MNEISQQDPVDRQLREAAPYIDDNGFTARVLQQLPAPRRPRRSLRGAILLAATLLASALAYLASDGGRFVVVAMERLSALPALCALRRIWQWNPGYDCRGYRCHRKRAN
jgi:hypothetical protein